ncbi:MAG: helix-turn-helix domain-containing protein [Pseudomonadota bacterium]
MADSTPCPIKTANDIFGGKWKPGILYRLMKRPHRYSELARDMPWVSERVLTRALKEMQRDGIVTRTATGSPPMRVEYALSAEGDTLRPVLAAICDWGTDRLARDGG